jgi:hypothetical protein
MEVGRGRKASLAVEYGVRGQPVPVKEKRENARGTSERGGGKQERDRK